jgi:hypothetical protein
MHLQPERISHLRQWHTVWMCMPSRSARIGTGQVGGERGVASCPNLDAVAGEPGAEGVVGDRLAGDQAREQPANHPTHINTPPY